MKKLSTSPTAVTRFTQELVELLRSDVMINDALLLMATSDRSSKTSRMARILHRQLQDGHGLVKVMQQHSNWFNSLYLRMVEAGVITGNLSEFLAILADYRASQDALRQKFLRAFAYPICVLALSMLLVIVLLVQVVPRFHNLFAESGERLPRLTIVMLDLSSFMTNYGFIIFFALVCLVLLLRLLSRWRFARRVYQGLAIHMPVIGKLVGVRIKEHYLRSLSIMLQAQVSLVEANNISARSCQYIGISKKLESISIKLEQGTPLDQLWQSISLFNQGDVLAASTGYKGARLDQLLLLRANYYRQNIHRHTGLVLRLLEPFLMILIGAIVCVIVLSIYLPLFSIGQIL